MSTLTMTLAEQKRLRNRADTVYAAKLEIMTWYLEQNNGNPPTQQCEDVKSYRGKKMWWLEPPLPFRDNPCLVEEYIGDEWSLRTELLITTGRS